MKPDPRPTEAETDEPSEYDRFQDLARKLIAVPKSEIDKARQPKPA